MQRYIQDEYIGTNRWMAKKAKGEQRLNAKWFRAILPASLMGKAVGWQEESLCSPTVIGDFDEILESTAKTGTDGAGGRSRSK